MKRRSFLTTASLAVLSTSLLKANTPNNLDQWLTQNQISSGKIKLYPSQAVDRLSQLSNIIDTPLQATGNKLSFTHQGTQHQLTLQIAA